MTKRDAVQHYIENYPELSNAEIGRMMRISPSYVAILKWQAKNNYNARVREKYREVGAGPYSNLGHRRWEPYEDEYLRENWASKSASEIGFALQRSRHSVIGRVHRLGLSAEVAA